MSMLWLFLGAKISVEISTIFFEFLNQRTARQAVSILSFPWRFFGDLIIPDSMFIGLALPEANSTQSAEFLSQWRNFILLSIATYSIFPRLALFIAFIVARKLLQRKNPKPAATELFKISLISSSVQDYFTLSEEEQRLLVSLQYQMVRADIDATADPESKRNKFNWLLAWQQNLDRTLSMPVETRQGLLHTYFADFARQGYSKGQLLLFECLNFQPYFQLPDFSGKKLKYESNAGTNYVESIAIASAMDFETLIRAPNSFKTRLKMLTGLSIFQVFAITVGSSVVLGLASWVAAPVIGAAVGGSMLGFHGVVAQLAGLAMLGGGATALGGFGVAGGILVVAGGGAILGGLVAQ